MRVREMTFVENLLIQSSIENVVNNIRALQKQFQHPIVKTDLEKNVPDVSVCFFKLV